MGKRKQEADQDEDDETRKRVKTSDAAQAIAQEVKTKATWEELLTRLEPIACPLAPKKLTKKLYKTIKKAQKQKQLRKGVREVQKFIRRGEKRIVLLAGDTNPIDVISHMPVVCEESGIPYCYVTSKEDLGAACGSRRQTCVVLIKQHDDYKDKYDKCFNDVKSLPLPL